MQNQRHPQICYFIGQSTKADWNSFRFYIAETLPMTFFNNGSSRTAFFISKRIFFSIKSFIPHKRYQQEPWLSPSVLQPWSTVTITTVSIRGNGVAGHFPISDLHATTARGENAKSNYMQIVQVKIEDKILGSHKLWKITNAIVNKGRLLELCVINGYIIFV